MIDVRVAGDAVEAQLRDEIAAEEMQGFRSLIDAPIRTASEQDLRVRAYWVLYFGSGMLNTDRIVPGLFVSSLQFTVTVAAGTEDRCLWGIEQVRGALAGVEIEDIGLISEVEQDLGSLRVDRQEIPPRQYLPLNFRLEP